MTAPTEGQMRKLAEFIEGIGVTQEEMQNFLGNGDLGKQLFKAGDLSFVNRDLFAELLPQRLESLHWNPVVESLKRLSVLVDVFGLKISDYQIESIAASLPDNDDPLLPTAIAYRTGKGEVADWELANAVLRYSLRAHGIPCPSSLGAVVPRYQPSKSRPKETGVFGAQLDLGVYWHKGRGMVAPRVNFEEELPNIEVPWLLALNPNMYRHLGATLPSLVLGGTRTSFAPCYFWNKDGGWAAMSTCTAIHRSVNSTVVAYKGAEQ